jgi:hypothetical protein
VLNIKIHHQNEEYSDKDHQKFLPTPQYCDKINEDVWINLAGSKQFREKLWSGVEI